MTEVRFDRMVPSMIVARRKERSFAYLPVGALEWHGSHMPFGTDYLTVQHIAEEAARRFGGVAFPAIYYGDVRYWLQECRAEWRNTYATEMDVPKEYAEAFPLQNTDGSPGYDCPTQPDDGEPAEDSLPFSRADQEQFFIHHIAMTLLEIHLYGFRNIILLPGHGSNPGCCIKAEEMYRQNVLRRTAFGPPAKTTTFFYIEPAKELEPLLKNHWIHADKFETSVTMAAAPDTIHLDLLPDDPKVIPPSYLGHPYLHEATGYNPEHKDIWHSFDALDPRNGSSEEYGKRMVDGVLEALRSVTEESTEIAAER
ncbi:MAG: hypothetical protein AUJ92_18485 [Armatimonadetes bacterium CG2_30_59_28]|nr:creatininase family protein [Armatimonadota bacterium]OIO90560.1 MAG: hypothetical protein AUJ92_18485 [Armatimonadetes bacterium CG2_30_59_28]PIU60707.1 MAG: hypothetical protein COS85_23080 [Armatimonadetes bacterium CG07_land_8_20_14_0_80_59_28]PIX38190.1 MAG: hypothetical protein COZ56_21135 [Armatimonadetes bacterium CG_4_8_14_3_um_filter_58_9]PIY43557.1 MAG: hypothetical protein COZ05_10700 [Armatimonadetes bacterium CG_4_10_14_3_um_filter_59_10]